MNAWEFSKMRYHAQIKILALTVWIGLWVWNGCAEKETSTASDAGTTSGAEQHDDTSSPRDSNVEGLSYPSGPYGTQAGETVADLEFITTEDTRIALRQIRADNPGGLLVVVTGAAWCSSCLDIHQEMQALHEDLAEKPVVIVLAMVEDSQFGLPDAEMAREWAERYQLDYPVVADAEQILFQYFEPLVPSMVMVIELDSMHITALLDYWESEPVETLIAPYR